MAESVQLKWGTIKGWANLTERSVEILMRYFPDGVPFFAMSDYVDDTRKTILCELIDQLDGDIENDWTGKTMTKDEAKEYVLSYRR